MHHRNNFISIKYNTQTYILSTDFSDCLHYIKSTILYQMPFNSFVSHSYSNLHLIFSNRDISSQFHCKLSWVPAHILSFHHSSPQHLRSQWLWTAVGSHTFCPFVLLHLSSINLQLYRWSRIHLVQVRTLGNLHHAVCPELRKFGSKCWSHPLMLERKKPCCYKYSFDWNDVNKRKKSPQALPASWDLATESTKRTLGKPFSEQLSAQIPARATSSAQVTRCCKTHPVREPQHALIFPSLLITSAQIHTFIYNTRLIPNLILLPTIFQRLFFSFSDQYCLAGVARHGAHTQGGSVRPSAERGSPAVRAAEPAALSVTRPAESPPARAAAGARPGPPRVAPLTQKRRLRAYSRQRRHFTESSLAMASPRGRQPHSLTTSSLPRPGRQRPVGEEAEKGRASPLAEEPTRRWRRRSRVAERPRTGGTRAGAAEPPGHSRSAHRSPTPGSVPSPPAPPAAPGDSDGRIFLVKMIKAWKGEKPRAAPGAESGWGWRGERRRRRLPPRPGGTRCPGVGGRRTAATYRPGAPLTHLLRRGLIGTGRSSAEPRCPCPAVRALPPAGRWREGPGDCPGPSTRGAPPSPGRPAAPTPPRMRSCLRPQPSGS